MTNSTGNTSAMNAVLDNECPICQCDMVLPFTVPTCGHKYCFTCLKGVTMANLGGCPICRGPIDKKIFKNPKRDLDLKMEIPGISQTVAPVKTEVEDEQEDVKPDVAALAAIAAREAALKKKEEDKRFWLYCGRNQGWWRFDPRNEKDIEEAFVNNMPITEVIICGQPYIIDFSEMRQYPKNRKDNSREVKRVTVDEFDTINVKGMAGVLVTRS